MPQGTFQGQTWTWFWTTVIINIIVTYIIIESMYPSLEKHWDRIWGFEVYSNLQE